MKAARYYGAKDIRIEEVPIPSVKENQVKIQVKYAGICGSDLHEYSRGPITIPLKKPYPLNGHEGATIMGHELSGVVIEIGNNVDCNNIKIGDRVVVEPFFRNPSSFYAKNGQYNLSDPVGGIGITGNGAFAKYCIVEDYMVHKIPDNVTFEQGALVEPAAVAVYAVQSSGLKLGTFFIIVLERIR